MKRSILSTLLFTLTLFVSTTLSAQVSGIVTYQKVVDFGIEPNGNERWDNFIKDLPKTGTYVYTLSFKEAESLFQEDVSQREETSALMQRALGGAARFNPPKVKVLQIYQNLDKAEKLEQVEFMTRNFVVEGKLEASSWKITTKKKKVLDYVCLGADMQVGDKTITAWFTSEIPVAFGPDGYHGLPGLIMGIEKNGDMLVLASKVELSALGEIKIPSTGQKINRSAFEETVKEKSKEWEANGTAAGSDRRGGN
ncbi:MAG: GLPGLI family protein [Roseivirga sp.]|jgi:GLPGLI family protein